MRQAVEKGGLEALAAKPHPGPTPRLNAEQKQHPVKILVDGPLKAGYRNDLWTCPRVAEVISRKFGVAYHPDHVWKILRSLGWTCQKPQQRARERDEAAIRQWREAQWPDWFEFEELPSYAPELNPVEQCWNHTKHADLPSLSTQPWRPGAWYPSRMLLAISATHDNDRGPQYMEQAPAAMLQGNVRRLPVSLLVAPYRRTREGVPALRSSTW